MTHITSIKQQKSSVKMIKMKPKLDELQKKYGKNREKYQEEMTKLYTEEGYNPMSGCAPLLIQLPILLLFLLHLLPSLHMKVRCNSQKLRFLFV